MILDFLRRSCPDSIEADICIVGAGAAGIAIAREFVGTDVQVCILESGGFGADTPHQRLCEGATTGPIEIHPGVSRVRAFGGTGNVWGGGCIPLSPEDFTVRDWIPYSGWPIGYDDLRPFYDRAKVICAVGSHEFVGGSSTLAPALLPLPFNGDVVENRFFARSQMSFGARYRQEMAAAVNVTVLLHATALEFSSNESASMVRSVRIATLDGRRGNVRARHFVLAAGGIENARLLLLSNSVAHHGLGNDRGLVGRFFMDHPSAVLGTLHLKDPSKVITPYDRDQGQGEEPAFAEICLTESAQRQHRVLAARVHPLAARSRPVSRGVNALRQLRARIRSAPPAMPILEDRICAAMKDYLPAVAEEPARAPPMPLRSLLWDVARGAGDVATAVVNRLKGRPAVTADWVDLLGYFEQSPNPHSRVTLGFELDCLGQRRAQVDWRLTALDRRSFRRAAEVFGENLASQTGGHFRHAAWTALPEGVAPPLRGTAHHMGTTRMAADPRDGVVDSHCKVHGVDNLFVAGSSVFPTGGGWAFPTLTIVALGLRVADAIKSARENERAVALERRLQSTQVRFEKRSAARR